MSHEECAEAVRARTARSRSPARATRSCWRVERADDGRLVGEVSLIWRSVADQQAEIGYILHPDVSGQGYRHRGGAALLAFGFDAGRTAPHLCPLRRAQRSLGAGDGAARHAPGGAFPRAHPVKGRWDEELIYAILDANGSARADRDDFVTITGKILFTRSPEPPASNPRS